MTGTRKQRTIKRGNSSRSFSSFDSGESSSIQEMAALEALRISTTSDKSGSLRKSVMSLAPQGPQTNSLKDFTINKLQFDKLDLFGRDEEIKTIRTYLDEMLSGSLTFRRLVSVSGPSGTGKTALAQTLEKPVRNKGGLYVEGKFSQQHSQEHPFSAIITACGQICGQLIQLRGRDREKVHRILLDLRDGLGSELRLLFAFSIPHLEILFESDSIYGRLKDAEMNVNSEGAKNRFHYALLRFLRIICKHFASLVMVIDDLQWVDEASLELFELIMIDRNATNVMIVGIFRSNEIHDDHIFKLLLQDLETRTKNDTDTFFEISTIEIRDLDLPAVHSIVDRLLRMEGESEQTKGLAELCLKKTHGNPFFLLRFLSVLNEMNLLQFNLGTLQWHWDEEEIESTIPATDNVADLLQAQMESLTEDITGRLKLAACLGSKFSLDLLEIAARHFEPTSPPESESNMTLSRIEQIIDLGYFVRGNISGFFQWSHDSIQDAALSLIPEESRPEFYRDIGEWLVDHLDEEEMEDNLFVVVNLLNKGDFSDATEDEKEKFAHLNYRAASKASALSAFLIAAAFASNGISMLPSEPFAFHQKLALGLYTVGAKAEGSVGNTEQMELYCFQVLAEDQVPMLDKLEIYLIWINDVLNRGNVTAAKELCLNVLQRFQCYIPGEHCMVAFGSWINTLRIKKSTLSPSNLEKLKELKGDPARLQLMRILDKLSTAMYLQQDTRLSCVIFRQLNWTQKYGYSEYSAPAFATSSLYLVGILNDLQGGRVYGEQALELLKKTDSRFSTSRTYMLVYGNSFAWTYPARDLCKPLLTGYDIGLKTGDIESALWNAYYMILVRFMLGTSLETLLGDLSTYSLQMRDLKRNIMACLCDSMKQVLLNIMGRDNQDSPTQWYGEAFSEEDQRTYDNDEYQMSLSWSSLLNTYFDNHIETAEITLALGHDFIAKARPASISIMWNSFFSGISCFAAARETEDAEYAKMGREIRKKVKNWAAMGNPNCKHHDMVLDAEFFAYKGQRKAAIKQYEAAFTFAARSGYQHDAALASQRLGDFYLNVMDDPEEATYRLAEAIKYWKGWGAHAIVSSIQAQYSDLELEGIS